MTGSMQLDREMYQAHAADIEDGVPAHGQHPSESTVRYQRTDLHRRIMHAALASCACDYCRAVKEMTRCQHWVRNAALYHRVDLLLRIICAAPALRVGTYCRAVRAASASRQATRCTDLARALA